MPIGRAHLRHPYPLAANLRHILRSHDKAAGPEMNLGQLSLLLRTNYLVDVQAHTQVAGMAFKAEELQNLFSEIITGVTTEAAKCPQSTWGFPPSVAWTACPPPTSRRRRRTTSRTRKSAGARGAATTSCS